jgi:hypothetical protein
VTLVEEINAFLGQHVTGVGEAKQLLRRAAAMLCGEGVVMPCACTRTSVRALLGPKGIRQYACSCCDTRRAP